MKLLIAVLVVILVIIVFFTIDSSRAKKIREENIARRNKYVESIGPNARAIVNDSLHLFFKDDVQEIFGVNDSGTTYSFDGLLSINKNRDGIAFLHKDAIGFLTVGKDTMQDKLTFALDDFAINDIYTEMMPVLRKNLKKELVRNGVNPTHEIVHDGEIWGCDLNSKQWYCAYGCPQVYKFSDLKKVTIDDVSNNSLCESNYIVNVYVEHEDTLVDYPDFTLYFDSKDAIFNNLLAMFKGIRNRQ